MITFGFWIVRTLLCGVETGGEEQRNSGNLP